MVRARSRPGGLEFRGCRGVMLKSIPQQSVEVNVEPFQPWRSACPSTANPSTRTTNEVVDWTDLGREMWSFLTGRQAAINYRFVDMSVEVPRDTGPNAPRATWKLNGTLTGHHHAGTPAPGAGSDRVRRHGPADLPSRSSSATPAGRSLYDGPARQRQPARPRRGRARHLRRAPATRVRPGGGRASWPARTSRSACCTRASGLITLGAVPAPWWQRRATRSRHIRLGSARGVLDLGRAPARAHRAGPPGRLPRAARHPVGRCCPRSAGDRRPVPTTHDPARGGGARLVFAVEAVWAARPPPLVWLDDDVTTIGSGRRSATSCSTAWHRVHAEVEHDERDEFVLVAHRLRSPGCTGRRSTARCCAPARGSSWVPGRSPTIREECADHGRPHGGRLGGELGRQRPQPPRQVRRSGPS